MDRSDYSRSYDIAGASSILDDPDVLFEVRQTINTHAWGISRDLVLDTGDRYYLQLRNDIYRDCQQPRLRLLDTPSLPGAFYSVWTCIPDLASELYFTRSEDVSLPTLQWGARYYALVRHEKAWYCLSRPVENWENTEKVNLLVGQGQPLVSQQTVFVPVDEKDLCASVYMGNRDFGEYKAIQSMGFLEDEPERFVVGNPTEAVDAAVGIFTIH